MRRILKNFLVDWDGDKVLNYGYIDAYRFYKRNPTPVYPGQFRDKHGGSALDRYKSFFHRKKKCMDGHNGIHGLISL